MQRPILLDFPDTFRTARLTIRAPRPGDGHEFNAAVIESWTELVPWMPWADTPPSVEASEETVREGHLDFLARRDLRMHLYLRGSRTLVGSSGLHQIDWTVPCFEIGYWCRTRFVGQGLISEAVKGITAFAFDVLGAKRVAIRCDARNDRSRRVAERTGFTLESKVRNSGVDRVGRLKDTLIFRLVPEEYEAFHATSDAPWFVL